MTGLRDVVWFLMGVSVGMALLYAVAVRKLEEIRPMTCHQHFKACVACADMMDEASGRKP